MTKDSNYFCPKCGVKAFGSANNHQFRCGECGFQFYHNVAATASLVVCCGGEVMFSKRGREPSKGLLDFPGGFVDPGETLEEALVREMYEELGWMPGNTRYLFSFSNTYPYGGILYNTADAFFICELQEKPEMQAQDDVEELVWHSIAALDKRLLAFESMVKAVSALQEMGY